MYRREITNGLLYYQFKEKIPSQYHLEGRIDSSRHQEACGDYIAEKRKLDPMVTDFPCIGANNWTNK